MPDSPVASPEALAGTTLDRRSLVRAAIWTVPAVATVAAAPAFASSGLPEGCTDTAVLSGASWRVREGRLNNPSRPNTGWSTQTSTLPHFSGAQVAADTFGAQPAGAFISFADNAESASRAVIEVTYEFTVTGTVTLQLASNVTFGYGVSDTPGFTERQTAVVKVIDGGSSTDIAKFALERVAAGGVQRPAGSLESRLARKESELAGYELLGAPDAQRQSHLVSSSTLVLSSASSTPRVVNVVYELTLDRRGQAQVNDDIIIPMPTLISCA